MKDSEMSGRCCWKGEQTSSTGDMRKTSQLMFPGRTGEPGQRHEGEITSDRVADTFLQIQLDITAA